MVRGEGRRGESLLARRFSQPTAATLFVPIVFVQLASYLNNVFIHCTAVFINTDLLIGSVRSKVVV